MQKWKEIYNEIPNQVQTCSAHQKTDQWIWEMRDWGKKETWMGESADFWEDGRLAPQNNCLTGVWIPGSFTDQRWRGEVKKQSKKAVYLVNIS